MSLNSSSLEQVENSGATGDLSGDTGKSTLVSKNVTILGRRTSVRLEPEMWNALKDISKRERCTIHDICSLIHIRKRPMTSLTAAIRVFLMLYYRAAATSEGHVKAGHGDFENMKSRARINTDLRSLRSINMNAMSDVGQSEYQWIY